MVAQTRCPACGVLCGVKKVQGRRYYNVHGPGRDENCAGSLQPVLPGKTRAEALLAIALDLAKDYAVYDRTRYTLTPIVTPLEEFNAEQLSEELVAARREIGEWRVAKAEVEEQMLALADSNTTLVAQNGQLRAQVERLEDRLADTEEAHGTEILDTADLKGRIRGLIARAPTPWVHTSDLEHALDPEADPPNPVGARYTR